MSGFKVNAVTDVGVQLVAELLAGGSPIEFTSIVLGDGYIPDGTDVADMTAVVSPRVAVEITEAYADADGYAVVGGKYDNSDEPEGFYWREIGLYADGDDGEVLYSYGNAGDGAEWIPATSSVALEKIIEIVTYIGTGVEVTAEFSATVPHGLNKATITIPADGWSDELRQTVECPIVSETSVVWVSPTAEGRYAYSAAGLFAVSQGDASLTFTCDTLPTQGIDVYVASMEPSGTVESGGITLDAVTIGSGLELTSDGTLNVTAASDTDIGGIVVGDDLEAESDGTTSVTEMTSGDIADIAIL